MTRFLLDTNVVSDLVQTPAGRAAACLAVVGEQQVATSIIVAAELRYGAVKKGSARLAAQLEAVLGSLPIIDFSPPADAHFAALRNDLERGGTPIGAFDMLIAAHALALGATLVSDNEREFARVPGLKLVNWLR